MPIVGSIMATQPLAINPNVLEKTWWGQSTLVRVILIAPVGQLNDQVQVP